MHVDLIENGDELVARAHEILRGEGILPSQATSEQYSAALYAAMPDSPPVGKAVSAEARSTAADVLARHLVARGGGDPGDAEQYRVGLYAAEARIVAVEKARAF